MKGERRLWIVAAVALAARLVHLWFITDQPFYDLWTVWKDSDMHQFVAWGRHLAAGDWLDAATFRPYFRWQEAIAPPEVWSSWYGTGVYYQPPLYPYLLAVFISMTGGVGAFRVCQILLGALNCVLVARLGERLFGAAAAWVAGLGAALYAPFIMYDAEILRGTLVITTQLALLLALAGRRALVSGIVLGIAYLAEPSILLFAPPAAFWLWWRGRWRELGLLAAGAALALAPLAARNAAVGAPLLSSTTRGPLAFVMGNAPDARPGGAYIPPSTGEILRGSGYSMGGTIRRTLGLYDGRWSALAARQWEKLRSLWSSYEVPDNPSFYYAARVSPVVRYGLRFLPVAALGLVGLGLALPGLAASPGRLLLAAYLAAAHAVFLLAHVVSRYRQTIAVAMLLFAGWAVARMLERGKGPLWRVGIAAAAVAAALALPWSPPEGYGYARRAEFYLAADLRVERGRADLAAEEIRALIAAARAEPTLSDVLPDIHFRLGTILAGAGRHAEAVAAFRDALALDPRFGEAADALEASEAEMRRGGGAP